MSLSIDFPQETAAHAIDLAPGIAVRGLRSPYDRNEEIFGAGEAADYIYKVVSGAVRTMRFSSDGRRQILAFHMPGDVFGLESGDVHEFSAEAVTNSEIVLVRRTQLEKAMTENPRAAASWLQLTARNLLGAREHAIILGRKGASERVAAFLLSFAEDRAAKADFDLPMSRADIADYLGLTIETVSRAFTEMERQAAIELPTSRHVVVRSRSALTHLEAA